ncbi:MAG: glycosyltransferase [Acidimicrobiales bacterium]
MSTEHIGGVGQLAPYTHGWWSGGGRNLLENVALARRLFPEVFTSGGGAAGDALPVLLRNAASPAQLRRGGYVYVPQNAWAWAGPTAGGREAAKRLSLRFASEVAARRALRTIRIGPMIPRTSRTVAGYLPNALDLSFEKARAAVLDQGADRSPTIVVVGSIVGYRNLPAAVKGWWQYRTSGGTLRLDIAGPVVSRAAEASLGRATDGHAGMSVSPHRLSRVQVLELFATATVALFPSLVEASPVAPIEAAAMGTPVILWDTPAHSFLNEHVLDDAATLVGDVDTLADALALAETGALTSSFSVAHRDVRDVARRAWCEQFVRLARGAAP